MKFLLCVLCTTQRLQVNGEFLYKEVLFNLTKYFQTKLIIKWKFLIVFCLFHPITEPLKPTEYRLTQVQNIQNLAKHGNVYWEWVTNFKGSANTSLDV